MKIEVVYALPERAEVVSLQLPAGSTIAEAVAASGLQGEAFGIYGKKVSRSYLLKDGDRIEIYRPLKADPKEARRRRAKRRR